METLTISKDLTQFSGSLYQGVAGSSRPSDNIVISPISIVVVYVIALIGARGNTSSQMKETLTSCNCSSQVIGDTVAALVNQAKKGTTGAFKSFNHISVSNQFHVEDRYRSILSRSFQCPLVMADFSSPGIVDDINRQVLKFSNGRISHFLPNDAIDSTTVMILLNGVDFKGHWHRRFRRSLTRRRPFHVDPSGKRRAAVSMMYTRAAFRIANLYHLDTRVLELPYKGKEFSMLIFLPNRVDGLKYFEKNLLSTLQEDIDEKMHLTLLDVAIPKFRTDSSLDVKDLLKAMGVKDLFDPNRANLRGISSVEGLHVSKMFQRVNFEVNERGSRASAATGMVASRRSLLHVGSFVADHPFLYVIRHKRNRTILFIGRYVNP